MYSKFCSYSHSATVECSERVIAVSLVLLSSLQSSENYLQKRLSSLHVSLSLLLSLKNNLPPSPPPPPPPPPASSSSSSFLGGSEVLKNISEDVQSEIESEPHVDDTLTSISKLLASLIKY